jgi:hypothetical protein
MILYKVTLLQELLQGKSNFIIFECGIFLKINIYKIKTSPAVAGPV